jgi:hypothetical protein
MAAHTMETEIDALGATVLTLQRSVQASEQAPRHNTPAGLHGRTWA